MSWDIPPCSLTMAFCLVQLLVLAKKISTSTSAHLLHCGHFHFSSTDPSHTNICNTLVSTLILEFHCEVFSDNSSCRLEKLRTSQPTIMAAIGTAAACRGICSSNGIPRCRWLKQRYIYACCVPWDIDCDNSHHCLQRERISSEIWQYSHR